MIKRHVRSAPKELIITDTHAVQFRSKYEIVVGHLDEEHGKYGVIRFPERNDGGIYIVVADRNFKVHKPKVEFKLNAADAFISSEDLDGIGLDGEKPLALKICINKESVTIPQIPLQHIIDGHDISESSGYPATSIDLTSFGVSLRIVRYDFPDSLFEALAFEASRTQGRSIEDIYREEEIKLSASPNDRLLFAYGQSLYLFDRDISNGIIAAIPTETEIILRISRKPKKEDDIFYSSFGIVIILEDLGTR